MGVLSLEVFRQVLGLDPWHFWGFTHPTLAPRRGQCDDLFFEEAYQAHDRVGRRELRRYLDEAEDLLARYLGYEIGPKYRADTLSWPAAYQSAAIRPMRYVGADYRYLSVHLPRGRVIAAGAESLTLVGSPSVSLIGQSATSLPQYFEATVTVPMTVTNASQLAVYYPASERTWGEGPSDRWRITPVSITLSGSTATIRGPAWMLARPSATAFAYAPAGFDPTDAANFCATVDVYRRTTNPDGDTTATAQAVLTWQAAPIGWWFCCQDSSDPAGEGTALARVAVRDAELGIVAPAAAVRDATTGTWAAVNWDACVPPDRVTVRYLSGLPLQADSTPAAFWALACARLAAARMPKTICACETANRTLHRWQFDLARTDGAAGEQYGRISERDLANPLGTRLGEVMAWRAIEEHQIIGGVSC